MNGVIERYSILDYGQDLLVGSIESLENLPDANYPILHEYHQPEVSNSSCTIHAGIGAISNIYDKIVTLETRKDLWNKAKENGAGEGIGWYIDKAVDLIRKWNNETYDEVATFKIKNGSEMFYKLLEKGYIGQTGGKRDMDLIRDKNEDGVINETLEILNPTFGHSVDFFYKDGDVYILDSFKNTAKYNIYRVENLDIMIKNKVFFENSYFYIPLKNLQMEKEDLEMQAMIQLGKKLGISNCERIKDTITREEAVVMIARSVKIVDKKINDILEKIK